MLQFFGLCTWEMIFFFKFVRLLEAPIDSDYLQFYKGNTGSPCCEKDQKCLHSSRLLPSLILQFRVSELIAFLSIWHVIFHISSSHYIVAYSILRTASLWECGLLCLDHYYRPDVVGDLILPHSNFRPLPCLTPFWLVSYRTGWRWLPYLIHLIYPVEEVTSFSFLGIFLYFMSNHHMQWLEDSWPWSIHSTLLFL